MIAAIYARKSTSQEKATEEAKSVTRQIELARAFAERQGWTVAEVYQDDGISGGEFTPAKRPGLARLVTASKAKPRPFDVIVTMSQSRLARRMRHAVNVVHDLADAGVRLFFYQTGLERKMDTAAERFMVGVDGFSDESYRESVKVTTRETLRRKAERGEVAGGKVYGYLNVRVAGHVEREILEAEAEVIRRIFREIGEGRGYARVAQGLNADATPCPRGRRWAMTCVREMVYRELYRGRIVYGKTRWQDRGDSKVKVRVPESEWITVEAPALRIVPAELWRAAHARLDRTRQTYLRAAGGKLWGRPEAGIEARHLLTGFVVCGVCGGAMHAIRRTSRRGEPRVYFTCNNWRVNGACGNRMSAHVGEVDTAVLGALRGVICATHVENVINRAVELAMEEPEQHEAERQRLTSEAQRLSDEITRLTEAIASGAGAASLGAAVAARERQRADALARLEHMDGIAKGFGWGPDLRARLQKRLDEWTGFLAGEPVIARQILRKLIDGRLTLTPRPDTHVYEISGQATYGRLLEGVVAGVVPPGWSEGSYVVPIVAVVRAA